MATRVGTGVTGTADGASGTIQSNTKATTSGNFLCHFEKWEVSGVTVSSYTTISGDAHTVDQQLAHSTGGEPHGAIGYKANITANAAEQVTANFSAATATFRRIFVEEFSGIATSSPVDGTHTTGQGTASPYSASAINTTTTGLVFAGVGDFNALGGIAAAGTPTFTLGNTLSDCFTVHLISGSAQTVTPGASSTSGATRWVMLATAFKDASAAVASNPGNYPEDIVDSIDTLLADEALGIPGTNRNDVNTGAFSAAQSATVAGSGASTASDAFSSTETATVTGSGASTATADFNTTSTETTIGVGASTVSAAGSISATATVIGDAKSTGAGAYSSAGTATVIGDAKSTAAGDFNTAGVLTLVGDNPGGGSTIVSAAASSVSTATVTGVGASTAAASFAVAGTATLVGTAAATVAANGNIVITGVLTGASATSARRRSDGWKPKKREDDFLMELAEMLVPVLHANQYGA
jgi:hypothetical protein